MARRVKFKKVSWTFFGRVLPDMPIISLVLPRMRSRSSLGFEYQVEGTIHNSKIMVSVLQLGPVDVLSLRNAVASHIQASVDLAGFLAGAGLDVDLISALADDGSWRFFDAFIPAMQQTGELAVRSDLIIAVFADIAAQIMLGDFREAMRVPVQTGFFCYRAIEAAMQAFRTSEISEKDAWVEMRERLKIEKTAIDRVKPHADWARHGRSGSINDPDRLMLLTTTKSILQRYLDYIQGGRSELPADTPMIS